jgi:3-oxoacyl-[acyl-carrier-protein] synthase-1
LAARVFVTGAGIISAIGHNKREVLDALVNQRSGIGHITRIETIYRGEIPVAEVNLTDRELRQFAAPVTGTTFSRTGLLALAAAREALHQAGIEPVDAKRTALLSGTTVGGMDRTEVFYRSYAADATKGRLRDVAAHDCGAGAEAVALELGIRGFVSTFNTACSSSANAIGTGVRLIRSGMFDTVIAGGTDALTLFTLNGFNSLMILDREPCRPLDENRNGLNLGEGAAFVVLEREERVNASGRNALCEVSGFGNACDAYHQTASSPEGEGAWLSMTQALRSAGLEPSDISYINAHGTGTKNNDLSEGVALERIFPGGLPPVSSTKAYTGHTLGAAGALEAVISILSLREGVLFPNLRFSTPMRELNFSPVTTLVKHRVNHIMSNSFGFGGNNSTLIFSRIA